MSKINTSAFLAAARDTMADALSACYDIAVIGKAERGNASDMLRGAVVALFANVKGVVDRTRACEALFGTKGLKSNQDGYVKGMLRETLEARGVDLKVVSVQMAHVRAVAYWGIDDANLAKFSDAKGNPVALRTLYDMVPKDATKGRNANKTEEPTAVADMEQLIAKYGVARTLALCSKILATKDATKLEAKTIETIAAKIAVA